MQVLESLFSGWSSFCGGQLAAEWDANCCRRSGLVAWRQGEGWLNSFRLGTEYRGKQNDLQGLWKLHSQLMGTQLRSEEA